MLGYISSTRRKSCLYCVKAKRRCDLGYPFCKRCFVKGLDCKYPNAEKVSSSPRDPVIIRQSTPDLLIGEGLLTANPSHDPALDIFSVNEASIDANTGSGFFECSTSSLELSNSSPENQSYDEWIESWRREVSTLRNRMTVAPRICGTLMPDVQAPIFITSGQTLAIIKRLCSFVPEIAYSGSTQFLHRALYRGQQPQAYQDCVALSALYLTKNPMNQNLISNFIDAKISMLIASSKSWALEEHLAAVQALIIYQVVRLFDFDMDIQAQAEKHNLLLERWTALLWKRFYDEFQHSKNGYERWVFNESVRRTVFVSIFVRCGWSCLKKDGLASQVPTLARLPLTRDLQAWEYGPDEWNLRTIPYITEEENLVSYEDMANTWTQEMDVELLGPFGKMLLAPCRADDPRLLE